MAGQGTKILAADYNTIQGLLVPILGTASTGYGQTLQSSQVPISKTVTVADWNALQNDIAAVNQHQLNAAPSVLVGGVATALTTATNSIKIKDTDRAYYLGVASALTNYGSSSYSGVSYPGVYVIAPAGQVTTPTVPGTLVPNIGSWPIVGQRTANWGGTASGTQIVTHTIIVSFANSLTASYFFNTGSIISFTPSFIPGTVNPKNTSWQALLNNVGTVNFTKTGITTTGGGSVTSYGWNYFYTNATGSNTQATIYQNISGTSYSPNQIDIICTINPAASQLTFQIKFEDLSTAVTSGHSAMWGIDEDVTGTLNSIVNITYASGSYVSVTPYLPTPSGSGP
jgi:hypothetical protein